MAQLERLQAAAADWIEITHRWPPDDGKALLIAIDLRIGLRERQPGGLPFREREAFVMAIPPDFPFDYPRIRVTHDRFAGFDHVIWGKTLCIYRSKIEWNPADGMYGFFERFFLWLDHAARNQMALPGGELEPPHHVTDFAQKPVVVRVNAPAAPGQRWLGWAMLEPFDNRVEIVAWHAFDQPPPAGQPAALAVFLPQSLPLEFPEKGKEFFAQLAPQGLDRDRLIRLLGMAALTTADGEPVLLALGLPMRRAADGSRRTHIAVWSTESRFADSLRKALPQADDSGNLPALRQALADSLLALFEESALFWCKVYDDRGEIVQRRDATSPMAWFSGKRVIILGCGALGGWAAEMIARAAARSMTLVDDAKVGPGLLARQNFRLEDIARTKASALRLRLTSIVPALPVEAVETEAFDYLRREPAALAQYDLILDCTASSILQMKLEHGWQKLAPGIRRFASFMTDAKAQQGLGIFLGADSVDGPWSAYLRAKYKLCTEAISPAHVEAFYGDARIDRLLQPEPGCSEPTFAGSMADVCALTGRMLNLIAALCRDGHPDTAIALTASADGDSVSAAGLSLPDARLLNSDSPRVLVTAKVINQVRANVRQNARLRSPGHETGGLLWGYRDDATETLIVMDASGPPPDSCHSHGHFQCGTEGTVAEHQWRFAASQGACGFLGFWHTHPDLPPDQSSEDLASMARLVSAIGQNQRQALMMIFGQREATPAARLYLFENSGRHNALEFVNVDACEMALDAPLL